MLDMSPRSDAEGKQNCQNVSCELGSDITSEHTAAPTMHPSHTPRRKAALSVPHIARISPPPKPSTRSAPWRCTTFVGAADAATAAAIPICGRQHKWPWAMVSAPLGGATGFGHAPAIYSPPPVPRICANLWFSDCHSPRHSLPHRDPASWRACLVRARGCALPPCSLFRVRRGLPETRDAVIR